MQTHRVVLIGAQGQGNTTFSNTITNQNQETTYAGYSCTRQIVQSQTVYGQGLEVIDTPGFDSSENKLLHISGILAALTFGKVNRIFIVTKYERNDHIIKNRINFLTNSQIQINKGQEEKVTQRIKQIDCQEILNCKLAFFSFLKLVMQRSRSNFIIRNLRRKYQIIGILEMDCDNADMMSDHLRMILYKNQEKYFKLISNLQTNSRKKIHTFQVYCMKQHDQLKKKLTSKQKNLRKSIEKKSFKWLIYKTITYNIYIIFTQKKKLDKIEVGKNKPIVLYQLKQCLESLFKQCFQQQFKQCFQQSYSKQLLKQQFKQQSKLIIQTMAKNNQNLLVVDSLLIGENFFYQHQKN